MESWRIRENEIIREQGRISLREREREREREKEQMIAVPRVH